MTDMNFLGDNGRKTSEYMAKAGHDLNVYLRRIRFSILSFRFSKEINTGITCDKI